MKKARILVAVIAITGIIGGSLAFKAARRSAIPLYTTQAFNAAARNTVPNGGVTATTTVAFRYYTSVYGANAPLYSRVLEIAE